MSEFLKIHERLLVIFGIIIVLFILGWKLLGHLDNVAALKEQTDQIALAAQQKQTQQLQQGYDQLQKKTDSLNQALQDANTKLTQQIQSVLNAVATQQAVDSKLSNSDLINRLELLTNQQNLKPDASGNGVDLTKQQTVTTTQSLEQIPALKKQVVDQNQQIQNDLSQINNLTSQNNSASVLLTNLNTELADQKKTCSAEITSLKVAGIKSRFKWFAAGYISGFVTKIFVHAP